MFFDQTCRYKFDKALSKPWQCVYAKQSICDKNNQEQNNVPNRECLEQDCKRSRYVNEILFLPESQRKLTKDKEKNKNDIENSEFSVQFVMVNDPLKWQSL